MLTDEYQTVDSPPAAWEAFWQIDRTDCIISANEHFQCFAGSSALPRLDADPVGQSLWEFIPQKELRHLLRVLLSRARQSGKTIDLPYRPPSNAHAIVLLRLHPQDHGRVTFRCSPYQPMTDRPAHPAVPNAAVRMCSWCSKVLTPTGWEDAETAPEVIRLFRQDHPPALTHGICDDCLANLLTGAPALAASAG